MSITSQGWLSHLVPGLLIINECIGLKIYTCESTLRGGAATGESLKSDFPTFGL